MRSLLVLRFIGVALAFALLGSTARTASANYVSNQVLVRFNPGATVSCIDSAYARVGGSVVDSLSIQNIYVVQLSDTGVFAAIAALHSSPCVAAADPNGQAPDSVAGLLFSSPNDAYFDSLTYLRNTGQRGGTYGADIKALEGWAFIHDSPNIKIGIMDTGVDYAWQNDLLDNIWTNPGDATIDSNDNDGNGYMDDVHGWDFYNNTNTPWDNYGHGTATAGYAAARGNNSIGFSGVTWQAQIVPLRIINTAGYLATESQIAAAVNYAINKGVKVLNNSWIVPSNWFAPGGATLAAAYDSAGAHGMVIVCGAGNRGENEDVALKIPATYTSTGLITVAATDQRDSLAVHAGSGDLTSGYGATTVDLAAPGVDLWGMYALDAYNCCHSGTSASSPMVAGAAALLFAQHPTWTNIDVKNRIMVTVDTLSSLYYKTVSKGRLNLGRALDNIPPSPVTFTYERGHHSVKIMWTETGDDTTDGTATVAAIRWSTTTNLNNETAFNAATPVPLDLPLAGSGTEHCITFTDLTANHTYYVGVKLEDGEFNWSGIGSGSVATLGSGNYEVEECPVGNRPPEARTPVRPTDGETLVWALESARPNPTSSGASIDYTMQVSGPVRIGVYDVAGRLVRTLENRVQPAGTHTVAWDGASSDGSRVRSGVYFYRMVADGWQSDRRLVVLGQ